jgi:hypothetical protein
MCSEAPSSAAKDAEARRPTGEIFAPVVAVYEPDAQIQPTGLTGPVVLRAYAARPQPGATGMVTPGTPG